MIGKISKGSDFGGILRYILQIEKGYFMNSNMLVDTTKAGNNLAKDLAQQFRENLQDLKSKAKSPVFHLAVSLPKENKLDDYTFSKIGEEYLGKLGFKINVNAEGQNQFVMARHNDTEHEHIHIVASRVGSDGSYVDLHKDFKKINEISRELEIKYGLKVVTNRKLDIIKPSLKEIKMEERKHQKGEKYITPRKELIKKIDNSLMLGGGKRTLQGMVFSLKKQGVNVRFNTSKDQSKIKGISFSIKRGEENFIFKGSSLGKKYSWNNIKKAIDYNEKRDAKVVQFVIDESEKTNTFNLPDKEKSKIKEDFETILNDFSTKNFIKIENKNYRDKYISFTNSELNSLKKMNEEWKNNTKDLSPIKHYEKAFRQHYFKSYIRDLNEFYKRPIEYRKKDIEESNLQKQGLKNNLKQYMDKSGFSYSDQLDKSIDALRFTNKDNVELKDLNNEWKKGNHSTNPMEYFKDRYILHVDYYYQELKKSLDRLDNKHHINSKSEYDKLLKICEDSNFDNKLPNALKAFERELEKGNNPDLLKYVSERIEDNNNQIRNVYGEKNQFESQTTDTINSPLFDNIAKGVSLSSGSGGQYQEEPPKRKIRRKNNPRL
ncbi:relaxase/mobilization nuclease domain-containing protein [Plebeiibacterium sediminum]|uniref:Relaxase/mobilization nuclease domain-containing protein n=1 Tax=Plebeiibacterium sediminum TaxID=2992112 RepID=A0AAE3M991_9BACT|nr:relaxase/mobilization nuclease domain-containing protein [Plebeiobacterium sediminum]MCW3789398.1 relaxase/mobilization nuclease domain-containing protein [Plebeiobacterium sediminum]